jgi:hypothetical protein
MPVARGGHCAGRRVYLATAQYCRPNPDYDEILYISPLAPTMSTSDSPLKSEIAVLTSHGISATRALQALDVQRVVTQTGLVSKVEAALGNTFAGVWFEPAAAQFHIGVMSNASADIAQSIVAQAGLTADATITPVRSAWASLVAAQSEWNNRLAKLLANQKAATGLDARHNAVSIEISSSVPARDRTALKDAAAAASVNILVRVVPPWQFRLDTP